MSTEHDPGGRQIRFLPTYTPDNPPPRLAPITWAQPTSEDNFHIIGRHVISPPGKPS